MQALEKMLIGPQATEHNHNVTKYLRTTMQFSYDILGQLCVIHQTHSDICAIYSANPTENLVTSKDKIKLGIILTIFGQLRRFLDFKLINAHGVGGEGIWKVNKKKLETN